MSSPETNTAMFHRTRQGLLAARVGGTAYLAIPRTDGKWLLQRTLQQL